jgi:hypothetical protein
MARTLTTAHRFYRGSSVGEYWLAHAEGFELASRGTGRERVEAVVVDPADGRAKGLIISASSHRKKLVPADAVVAVDPFARLLHVERGEHAFLPLASSALLSVVTWLRRAIPPRARAAGARLHATSAWLKPRLASSTVRAGQHGRAFSARTRAAATWLRPRLRTGVGLAADQAVVILTLVAEGGLRLSASASAHIAGSRSIRRLRGSP